MKGKYNMELIITNKYNLKDSDITEVVKRVKVLLINSNNEILLGYSHNEYQFPGGHVEENESLIESVNREIEEETGIILNIKELEPFACSVGYWKDWPELGKNRKTEVYFYEIKTDIKPKLDQVNYTEQEKDGNFKLEYVSLNNIEEVLKNNAEKYGDNHGIVKEMLKLLEVYKTKNQ